MNSRKVRYSCFLVCLSVLLGSSWTAPAVAGSAADLRLAAGPNWGGAGTPLPAPNQRVMPVRVYEPWEALWMDVWQKSNAIYRIGAADTVKQVPVCTGNLGLEVIVAQTVRAVRNRKFGDAVNWMAQFQDRSLCLHYEGARGLDFALAYYAERAIKELPADQQRIAIHGTFNLGMLAYGQISYTGRSWWKGIVGLKYYPQMVAQMNAYPILELGFWSFNFQNGMMEQFTSIKPLLDMLATLANLKPAGGTKSGGGSVQEEKGNTGAGGMQGPAVGAMGAGVVSCTIAASGRPGGRGMITCLQKATSGTRPSFTDRLAGPFDPGVSVRDPQCAMGTGEGDPPLTGMAKKLAEKAAAEAAAKAAAKEPPVDDRWWTTKVASDTYNYLEKALGGDGGDGGTPTPPEPKTKQECQGCAPIPRDKPPPAPDPSKPGMVAPGTPPGPGGTGGCGNASNAAKMAQAVANCVQGSSAPVTNISPKPGGPGGETNPHVPAGEAPGATSGKVDCMMQAGSQVRTSSIDPKCAKAMCAPGAPCSCEPGGGAGSQGVPQMRQPPLKAGPDCMDPNAPCGPGTGGITPGKTPPVGPGPTPGPTTGPGPPPPPLPGTIGTVSPSTTSVPATRGIGAAPQLQQQKGTTPVSPLQQIGR